MKHIHLFIFITIFSRTTAKVFLLTLAGEKGKEGHINDLDILEKGKEEEKVNQGMEAKGVELMGHDYSNGVAKSFFLFLFDQVAKSWKRWEKYPKKMWGEATVLGSGSTWWECRYRKTIK